MKTRIKGKGGVSNLLLLHGEKMLMAAVGLAAAAVVYLGFSTARLPDKYEPGKLESSVRATRTTIASDDNNFPKVLREFPDKARKADAFADRDAGLVDFAVYLPDRAVNTSVIKRADPRSDPKLLAAADPQAVGGAGLFGFAGDEESLRAVQLHRSQEEAARERAAKQAAQDQSDGGRRGSGAPRGAARMTVAE